MRRGGSHGRVLTSMFLLVVTWAGPNTETPSHGAASSFLHDGCRVMFRMVVRGTVVLTLELFALAFEVIFQFLGLLRYQSDSTHQRCRAATSDDRCHKGVAAAQQSQHRKQQSRKGGFHLAIHSPQVALLWRGPAMFGLCRTKEGRGSGPGGKGEMSARSPRHALVSYCLKALQNSVDFGSFRYESINLMRINSSCSTTPE